jgi:hypothetical protein
MEPSVSPDYVNVKQGLATDERVREKVQIDIPAAIANLNRDLLAYPSASLSTPFFPEPRGDSALSMPTILIDQ